MKMYFKILCLFLLVGYVVLKNVLYKKVQLHTPMMFQYYSSTLSPNSNMCAFLCAQHPECKLFEYRNSHCLILDIRNTVTRVGMVNVTSPYVDIKCAGITCVDDTYTPYQNQGKCLKVHKELKKWTDARDSCEGECGQRMIALNNWTDSITMLSASADVDSDRKYWVGGSDVDNEGVWTWLGGSLVVDGWNSNQPDDTMAEENCLEYDSAKQGINDRRCHIGQYFICESFLMYQ